MFRRVFVLLVSTVGLMPAADYLFPIREGRKFGLIDRKGSVILAPQYDAVGDIAEGRIHITAGSKSGYIDLSGKVVIEPKYDNAGEFKDARAIVRQEDKYALIDLAGKLIADLPGRPLGEFHQGLLRIQVAGRTDENGKRLPTTYGFVDRSGKLVIPAQFMPAGEFPDDAANLNFAGLNHDWCYFDKTGKILIRIPMGPNLNPALAFSNGRLRVKEGLTWGYKDGTGEWAIPPKYNDAEDFKEGVARVQDGVKWVLIDVHGKHVPEEKKKIFRMQPYSEGLAVATENGLLGWIDEKGKPAFPFRNFEEAHKFSNGMARIKVDSMYGYVDRSGNLKVQPQYFGAADFDHGLAFVQSREGIAYIDTDGKPVWKSAAR